ncbi:T9SS type A sorting domain-containing protein [Runella sp.]|uniref:T9SS type A sorting domain-containing protein n=1 Tax=Runella sp. TaxID=1960881 RepID=UPI00301A20EA
MKKLFILLAGSFVTVSAQAQLVSSTDVVISSGTIVTVNSELSNTGNFKSDGDLHLRKGLINQGQMSLNGQVVMDGEGTQVIQSPIQLKAGTFVMSQMGKVVLRAPLFVEQQLILGDGILENNELNLLEIADNGSVTGASNRSHVKGFVLKSGDDSFQFPVGNGSQLQSFTISKPSGYDEIQVGYINQNPTRLSSNRSLDVAELTVDNYWSVKGTNELKPLQVTIASEGNNEQILQLLNNQWNISPTVGNSTTLSSEALLRGATYFTIGTQRAELMEKPDVNIFPNPSSGSFEVRLKGFLADENISFDVIDLSGKSLVKQEGKVKDLKMKYSLDKEVNDGSYILRVIRTDKNQVFNQKLSINH